MDFIAPYLRFSGIFCHVFTVAGQSANHISQQYTVDILRVSSYQQQNALWHQNSFGIQSTKGPVAGHILSLQMVHYNVETF